MLAALELRVRDALRRGTVALVGGVCIAIGLGFLTAALWIALAARDPLFAALVLGGLYLVLGGTLLLRSRRRRIVVPPPQRTRAPSHLMLLEAFLAGLDAARVARGAASRRTKQDGI